MKVIGVIPARFASSRFEGKVLADLNGKPLLQHVWERACRCSMLDSVVVACDDERVLRRAEGFGAHAVMTSGDHASGTDRIAEVMRERREEWVVNIQGDEPLLDPQTVDALVEEMKEDRLSEVGTVITKIKDKEAVRNPNVVKVVVDKDRFALYFSRAPIPYYREQEKGEAPEYYKHLGLYAYTRDFILRFRDMPRSRLEAAEKLEQLRILEAGYRIKTVVTDKDSIGVDTEDDLRRVAERLKRGQGTCRR